MTQCDFPQIPLNFADVAQAVMVGTVPSTPTNFVPNYRNYVSYDGSFTTPPCTGVSPTFPIIDSLLLRSEGL